jgi:hypothetical protein
MSKGLGKMDGVKRGRGHTSQERGNSGWGISLRGESSFKLPHVLSKSEAPGYFK